MTDLIEKWKEFLPTKVSEAFPDGVSLEEFRKTVAQMLENQSRHMRGEKPDSKQEKWWSNDCSDLEPEDPGDIDNDDPMLVEGSDFGTDNEWP